MASLFDCWNDYVTCMGGVFLKEYIILAEGDMMEKKEYEKITGRKASVDITFIEGKLCPICFEFELDRDGLCVECDS